jgi:hypothetical protein
MNFDSSYSVYLATFKQCRGQYVGKSLTPFKQRHSNYKMEIQKHFGGLGPRYGGNEWKFISATH